MRSDTNSFQTFEPCNQNNFFDISLKIFNDYNSIILIEHQKHLIDGVNNCKCIEKIHEFTKITENIHKSYIDNTKHKIKQ